MKKILYLIAEDSYFCSHRLNLASFMKQQGHIVAVATNFSKYKDYILQQDLEVFELKHFCRASWFNPLKEILALIELYNIYKKFKPDIVHHVALKPVIYGTIIARLLKISKIINALAGLGFVFTEFDYKFNSNIMLNIWHNIKITIKQKILQYIVYKFLKLIIINNNYQLKNETLLLQNQDDLDDLKNRLAINNKQRDKLSVVIIAGSGINMEKYYKSKVLNNSNFNNNIKIVLISRLLWTKGINEFVQAAKQIKDYIQINKLAIEPEFILYGNIDNKNPASVHYSDLDIWEKQGLISWKNFCHDMVDAYSNCHIAVLPSYREGLPKTLLEAAACARAIVTTDVPGCREIVTDGINGYLVPKQNVEILVAKLLKLMQNQELMINMGKLSRQKIHDKFSEQIVFPQMLDLYKL